MVRIFFVGMISILTATDLSAQIKNNTADKRFRQGKSRQSSTAGTDTILVAGTQVIPINGRSTGIPPELQGLWLLTSIEGIALAERSSIHISPSPVVKGDIKTDSITTKQIINGQTITKTEVSILKPAEVRNITPPQGTNYHIPQRPTLSFFGLNETFTGFTGCNKISGRYKLTRPFGITFLQPAPSTRMACIGDYDENLFVNTLNKIESFKTSGTKMQMLAGDKILLEFEKP